MLRPGLHRVKAFAWVVVPLIAVSIVPSVAIGLLAPAGALIAARTTTARRMIGLMLWAVATTVALQWEDAANFVFAHGHNLVAIGLWWSWRKNQGRTRRSLGVTRLTSLVTPKERDTWAHRARLVFPFAFIVASVALIALAFGDGPLPSHDAQLTSMIAPVTDGCLATALVMWFAFAQAVHYGVWLRLIPEDDRERPAPRGFRESYRALVADAGPVFVGLAIVAALALAAWALFDLGVARSGYLRLALFHGHLELAAIAWLWASRTKATA